MIKKTLFLVSFLALMLAACSSPEETPSANGLNVVATVGMIADITQVVGGEHVQVTGLMGPGTDPHLFVATASDVDKLQNADIVFYNGLFLEAQMEDILEQLGERKIVLPVAGSIPKETLLASPAFVDEYDPHIWFDVTLWQEAVKTVRDTLIEVDPAHAETYETNATAYLAELDDLNQYVKQQADKVPEDQRVLITAHDAFGYFGRAYGFNVMGLQGISTASEASTADVQGLADFIAENKIPAIFIESSVPIRNVEAVQAAVSGRGFEVKIGGQLFSDAMGNTGTPEGTYIGMVRHNIDTIVSALLGE